MTLIQLINHCRYESDTPVIIVKGLYKNLIGKIVSVTFDSNSYECKYDVEVEICNGRIVQVSNYDVISVARLIDYCNYKNIQTKREAYKARRAAKREEEERKIKEEKMERKIEIQKEAYIRAMEYMNKLNEDCEKKKKEDLNA